jgi:hypothetical protein
MNEWEQYQEMSRLQSAAYEKAIGTMMPNANLDTSQDFEWVMRQLYLRSDEAIWAKLQEVLRNPPLDAWVIQVEFKIAWGNFNSTTQAFTRRSVAEAIGQTPFRRAYKKVCEPVPSDHVRVVVVLPIKDWFWIIDRPIRWRAPTDESGSVILEEAPLIVLPDNPFIDRPSRRDEPVAGPVGEPVAAADEQQATDGQPSDDGRPSGG